MPRKPDLKLHRATGQWYETVDGKRAYLGKDYDKAKKRLERIVRERTREKAGARPAADTVTLVQLFDQFIDHVRNNRARSTADNYQFCLKRALKFLDKQAPAEDISKLDVARIEAGLRKQACSQNTIRDTITTLQTAMNWAVEFDILERNPIGRYRKPARVNRSRIMTDAEFYRLLGAAHANAPFRKILIALRETGCRPCELRTLQWGQVDFESGVWIIPPARHKTGSQQEEPRPRIVPMTPAILKMCTRLYKRRGDATNVFLHSKGRPWSKDALVRCMRRCRERAGLVEVGGEKLVLYSNRHTFATAAIGQVQDIEVAELMGHTNLRTTRRYAHLNRERIKSIRRKII